jgi:amino acid transporter/mannitol/fructose-specific phosphotransferase system IIA component (Ntr-type)
LSDSNQPGPTHPPPERLPKELGLFDVYAISTGAMFSSGFFLLPGLAAAQTGPSVPLAYLVAGIFILPAMLSVAELATAMPRAGGAYYFLDRSLGPMVGTVGGLGTWLALVLKSAFALVGMGAYLAIYFDVPIEPLAVALTLAFMAINILGAKETSGLQRILVTALVGILAFFVAQGLVEVFSLGFGEVTQERFTPFLAFGFAGFMGTVGFVFVSYAGLTKVASVSEEIRNPDRNIPLGMALSLATASLVYTVGVYIIVAVLPPEVLRDDLTPVATAADAFFDWLPTGLGVGLIVVAAIAAFASTGNAGIMSASRYPLAMARDRLLPDRFAVLGRFRTPTFAIVVTALLMVVAILVLDVASIAKLASAFQLLLFSLLSLAVVIMRESGIEGYDPGYRSPLYPWMQIFGFLSPLWLIAEMGELAILFTLGLVAVTIGWYFRYARDRVERTGAIFHAFARLGTLRHAGLDLELRSIVREKGLREADPWDRVIATAPVVECPDPIGLPVLARLAAERLAPRVGTSAEVLVTGLLSGMEAGYMPVSRGAALPHVRLEGIPEPTMLLVRSSGGLEASSDVHEVMRRELEAVRAVLFLVSPENDAGLHLRLLGYLATRVDDPTFLGNWMAARGNAELRQSLLREERFLTLDVGRSPGTAPWAGRPIRALDLPTGSLVALIRRDGHGIIPRGDTVLRAGDQLTIIGEPDVIRALASGGSVAGTAETDRGRGPP